MFLFVYGTLKRGCWNHVFLRGARFVGEGFVRGYTLVVDDIPFAVKAPRRCRVFGEVYEVDDGVLSRVDDLEGHPNYYRRVVVDVELASGGSVEAFMYEWPSRSDRCLKEFFRVLGALFLA